MDRILTIKKPYSLKAVSPLDSLLIKNFLWDFFFFFLLSIKKMAKSKEHPNKTHWKLQKRKKEKKKAKLNI